MLTLLLDFGFDPDERVRWSEGPDAAYSQGYPLWHCAATGKQAMAELLLQRGASPNVHVDSSGSPVYAAYSHRQWAMVDLLKRYGGVVTPDIVGLYRETDLARELLARAPDTPLPEGTIPARPIAGGLSAGVCAERRRERTSCAWRSNVSTGRATTADGFACWDEDSTSGTTFRGCSGTNPGLDRGSYLTGFRLLVERCDPNVIGGFGRTALHEVAAVGDHVTETEASALAAILLDAGARMDVRDELFEEHAARLGVPLGPRRNRPDPARARRQPVRARRRDVGHAACLG